MERGHDQKGATTLLVEAIYQHTAAMLESGLSAKQVKQRLVSNGFGAQAAKSIIDAVLGREARQSYRSQAEPLVASMLEHAAEGGACTSRRESAYHADVQAGTRVQVMRLVGSVIVICGFVLLIGNWTQLLPTVPFAGFVTMGVGWAIHNTAHRMPPIKDLLASSLIVFLVVVAIAVGLGFLMYFNNMDMPPARR
jgi:hypothetical protein